MSPAGTKSLKCPIGWILFHKTKLIITLSALPLEVQAGVSRVSAESPTLVKYGAATAPLKTCSPYPSKLAALMPLEAVMPLDFIGTFATYLENFDNIFGDLLNHSALRFYW